MFKFGLIMLLFSLYTPAIGSPETIDSIVVHKRQKTMLLLRDGNIVKAYRIALGKDPVGHKVKEGDKKTPEGTYYIESRKADSKYYKALKISYPNETDRQRASEMGVLPGGLIMIHGLPQDLESVGRLHRLLDWTDGCIAVTNQEMDQLWDLVPVGVPVIIQP
jgi:murein L,D-transpeptidase YafK